MIDRQTSASTDATRLRPEPPAPDHELVSRLERAEMDAWAGMMLAAPPEVARRCGLHLVADRGATAAFASAVDVLAFNRVVGLGLTGEPATAEQLDRLLAVARSAGVRRLFVQPAPGHEPTAELRAWVEARGGRECNRWVRLCRRTSDALPPPPAEPTALEIRPVDGPRAADFARVVCGAFGMPPLIEPWVAAAVGRPGWHHYAAFDGAQLVGGAALYASGDTGWLGFAGTLASHRGQGAQGALIARRIEAARALGCQWLSVETAEDSVERNAPSYRNMLRMGFTEAYRRPNYLVTLAAAAGA